MRLKGTERNVDFFWDEGTQEVRMSVPVGKSSDIENLVLFLRPVI
jgi:hypothetical protein